MSITASEARRNLFPLIEQVNDDRMPIRSAANAKRLLESLQQVMSGDRTERDLTR